MSKRITQDELETYLWGSAVLLRNHIDAGAYKQYIFPLLFFKRLNDAGGKEEDMVPHGNHDDVPPIDSLTDRLGAKTAQEDRAAVAQGFATA